MRQRIHLAMQKSTLCLEGEKYGRIQRILRVFGTYALFSTMCTMYNVYFCLATV